jgi:hypothetical protein
LGIIEIQMELYKTAPYLEFLPLPKRIEENETWKEGVERVKANDVVPGSSRPRARFVAIPCVFSGMKVTDDLYRL